MDDVISAAGSNDVMTIASPDDIIAVASIDGVASVTRPENLIQAVADEQIIFRRAVQLPAVTAEHRTFDEPDSLEPAVIRDAVGELDRTGVAGIETYDDVLFAIRGNDLRGPVIDRVDAHEMQVDMWRTGITAVLAVVQREIICHDSRD